MELLKKTISLTMMLALGGIASQSFSAEVSTLSQREATNTQGRVYISLEDFSKVLGQGSQELSSFLQASLDRSHQDDEIGGTLAPVLYMNPQDAAQLRQKINPLLREQSQKISKIREQSSQKVKAIKTEREKIQRQRLAMAEGKDAQAKLSLFKSLISESNEGVAASREISQIKEEMMVTLWLQEGSVLKLSLQDKVIWRAKKLVAQN